MTMNKMTDNELDLVSGGTILPYKPQPGDTLDMVAARYHVTTEQLMKWNNIQNPNALDPNQTLKIKF